MLPVGRKTTMHDNDTMPLALGLCPSDNIEPNDNVYPPCNSGAGRGVCEILQ